MTVERLQAALTTALARPKITTSDVDAFREAVLDDGGVSQLEADALRSLAAQYQDRFDPTAATQLQAMIAQLQPQPPPVQPQPPPVQPQPPPVQPQPPPVQPQPPPVQPQPPPVQPQPPPQPVVSWDTFSVPDARDGLDGTQKDEGLETFDQLSAAVTAGALSKTDQLLLASSAARLGVMGEAQALRSVALLEKLPTADAKTFGELTDKAASPMERAFLFKALAAGHTLDEVGTFETAIHGWDNKKLLSMLNMADPILDDGVQTGVKQQWHASCVPTTGQALRGEVDPIYSLQVRTENTDIHTVDEADGFKVNKKLAEEQKAVLEGQGGVAEPRSGYGAGTAWEKLDNVYNARTAQTGFVYNCIQLDQHPEITLDKALDMLAKQLNQGIPTPLLVGVEWAPKCHAMIALDVQGTGPDQRFLIHDPWGGDTMWVKRSEFLAKNAPMGEFKVLGGLHIATPAPPAQPVVPTPPAPPNPPAPPAPPAPT